jgi:hypothetical protein
MIGSADQNRLAKAIRVPHTTEVACDVNSVGRYFSSRIHRAVDSPKVQRCINFPHEQTIIACFSTMLAVWGRSHDVNANNVRNVSAGSLAEFKVGCLMADGFRCC